MPKIYTEQQTTELYNSTGEPGGAVEAQRVKGYARQMDADAQRYERQAKQTYSTALKISASDTMNQLYAQYPDDPVKLQEEFKKAYDKSVGEIADDDVKVDFMANMTLQSQSYISKAIDNKKKKEYRIMKSTTFDGIDKNTQMLGLSFSTLLGDDFNPDNVGVYNIALNNNNAMINTLNDDGTYMFTDEQRKRMRDDMDKAHLDALKSNFNSLEPHQMNDYYAKISEDNLVIPVGVSKDKEIIFKNVQDVVSPESYEKFKTYADNVIKRASKISKSAKEAGIVMTPEEAKSQAILQRGNKDGYKDAWKDISKRLEKDKATLYDVFDYRNSLQDTYESDGLSDKDYEELMADTITPVIEKTESQSTGQYRWFNDSFKVGAYRINDLMKLENQTPAVKAAAYTQLYKNFAKYNLDPSSNFEDSEAINKCVTETVKQLAVNNDPRLLGVNAQRVLTGTKMIEYDTTNKPKTAGELNYVIKLDPKTNTRYKIYKNKDGSVDNNSFWVRLQ